MILLQFLQRCRRGKRDLKEAVHGLGQPREEGSLPRGQE